MSTYLDNLTILEKAAGVKISEGLRPLLDVTSQLLDYLDRKSVV